MGSVMKCIAAGVFLCSILLVLFFSGQSQGETYQYVEDFTNLQYCDILKTTALWDIASGELKLPPFELTLAGGYDAGDVLGLAVSGDYAYLTTGNGGFQVVNISEPTNPTLAGGCGTYYANRAAIAGNYAYVADGLAGLKVIDISDPTSPTVVGSCDTPGSTRELDVSGNYAYVTDGEFGVEVIDISVPTSPFCVGRWGTPGVLDVAISGDHAYVVVGAEGFHVLDISDPANPVSIGSHDTPGNAGGIAISGDYAYVADGVPGLQVFDISDPANPTLVGNLDWSGNAFDVTVTGDYVFLASYHGGLQMIGVSDPTNPVLLGYYVTERAYQAIVSGDHAFVADGPSGLQVIRIADLVVPPNLAGGCDAGYGDGLDVSGDYVYMATGVDGLQVINISDPTNPSHVGGCSTNYALDVVIAGDYAYVADYREGLKVIDIRDPRYPTLAGSCDTPGLTGKLDVSGNYVYITDNDFGLQVIDISDPMNPSRVGSWEALGVRGVAVSGDHAYIVGIEGFHVLDISNPANPVSIGSHDTPGDAGGVAIAGDYAYVADGVPGLQVFDISDPANPALVGNLDWSGNAFDLAIAGDYVFLASYHGGLQMIGVSDPTNPVLLGYYVTERAYQAVVSGDYAFVADGPSSLQVIEIFQRRYDLHNNTIQSLEIDEVDAAIVQARITTVQTDSIRWELSADGGDNWIDILPDSTWQTFAVPGNSLIWRTTHVYVGGNNNPSCTSLMLEWDCFQEEFGAIEGRITADCPVVNTPLYGVDIDVYESESGDLIAYATTDEDGFYVIDSLSVGDYILTLVRPLGYRTPQEEQIVTIAAGDTANVDFSLSCIDICFSPRCVGFWKHQIGVATGGPGQAQIDAATLCVYLDIIEAHFNSNSINQVVVYEPPASGECYDKLLMAKELLNLKGDVETTARAKQQLAALLFNVASDNLSLREIISEDSATVSQAITYCDWLIDDPNVENDETAMTVAAQINRGEIVAADVIPLTTSYIAYGQHVNSKSSDRSYISGVYPNPFNPQVNIVFYISSSEHIKLNIYDVQGRLIRTLVDGVKPSGEHNVMWDGRNERGIFAAAGIYFVRIKSGIHEQTKKIVLLR